MIQDEGSDMRISCVYELLIDKSVRTGGSGVTQPVLVYTAM